MKLADAAFLASYDSSLIGAEYALDGVAATTATTLDADGVHYLQVTLGSLQTIWGVRAVFEPSSFPRGYTLGICSESVVTNCDWSSLTVYTTDVNRDNSLVISFEARPARHLMFSLRLPAELAAGKVESSLHDLESHAYRVISDTFSKDYRLATFEVYQSSNIALTSLGATASANAYWNHSPSKALDG